MEKEWIEKHIDDMVQDICKLSEIPSVSVKTEDPDMPFGQACLDALHAALDLGRSMGFETFNHENYCGTLLWKGESAAKASISSRSHQAAKRSSLEP